LAGITGQSMLSDIGFFPEILTSFYRTTTYHCETIYDLMIDFDFWCLTPLSAIFQLYHGDQF
jgi:hypothetical protein